MHLNPTGRVCLLLGIMSCCNSGTKDASKASLDEQVSPAEKEPTKSLPKVSKIQMDAAPPVPLIQIESFESTSIQQAIVDLGKLETLTIDHFQQAFPGQEMRVGPDALTPDTFKEKADVFGVGISKLDLSLHMRNFQLVEASLGSSSEIGIKGIVVGDKFKKVFQNEPVECKYEYYEAGVLTCYLPDNWNFSAGFDGRNDRLLAKEGSISTTKAKRISRRKKVDWINWVRERTSIHD